MLMLCLSATVAAPPNIFFMLTDDQDTMLGSMEGMPFTRELGRSGVNLTNFFAHTPVCCPSRSELLTGRYFHNIRDASYNTSANTSAEVHSGDDCMHVNATMNHGFETMTFANALRDLAHYRTGMFGKYLNQGGMRHICGNDPKGHQQWNVPVGWDDYMGACPDTCYVNCTYNINGTGKTFDNPDHKRGSNYGTSLIGNASLAFVEAALQAGEPFFAYVASHAPHGPATPAPWYENLYPDSYAPRTAAYDVYSPDKHWVVATQPKITDKFAQKQDSFFRDRLRSLRSVDDIIHDAHSLIDTYGALNNTYFVLTGDHGLHMGQYRLGYCKRQPYEYDLRVPMLFVGPSIVPGTLALVAGIPDLAPTFLELAGLPEGDPRLSSPMDGRSLVSQLLGRSPERASSRGLTTAAALLQQSPWRTSYLIEYYATTSGLGHDEDGHLEDSNNNTFIGLRVLNASLDLAYFEFTDVNTDYAFEHAYFCELYNLTADPHQLVNMCSGAGPPPQLQAALRAQLYREWSCRGSSCQ